MKLNKYGLFDEEMVRESGLPMYSHLDLEDKYFPIDYWTFSELKEILKIVLTPEERELMIVGFRKSSSKQKGFAGLYSMTEVINKRYGMNAKFFGQFEESE